MPAEPVVDLSTHPTITIDGLLDLHKTHGPRAQRRSITFATADPQT